jgi:CrcB protein
MNRYLAVMAGAAAGGLARYILSSWINARYRGAFPLGTFTVNVTGCFLIGILAAILTARFPQHMNLRLFLIVGILGGYTTFSSFALENFEQIRSGEFGVALLNSIGSVVVGTVAVWLGHLLATAKQ